VSDEENVITKWHQAEEMPIISEWDVYVLTAYVLFVTHSIGNVSDLVAAIVEKNPGRFRLDSNEVIQRRYFIQSTRDEIADIKDKVQIQMRGRDVDHTARKVKFLVTSFTSCTSLVHRRSCPTRLLRWRLT
jgi:Syntaxin 6, N-terminal